MRIEVGGRWLIIGNIILNTDTITKIEVVESNKSNTHSIAFYSVKDIKFCAFYKESNYLFIKYKGKAERNNYLLSESEFLELKAFVLESLLLQERTWNIG